MAVYTGLDVISADRKLFLEDLRAKNLLPILTSDLMISSHFPPGIAMIIPIIITTIAMHPSLFPFLPTAVAGDKLSASGRMLALL